MTTKHLRMAGVTAPAVSRLTRLVIRDADHRPLLVWFLDRSHPNHTITVNGREARALLLALAHAENLFIELSDD